MMKPHRRASTAAVVAAVGDELRLAHRTKSAGASEQTCNIGDTRAECENVSQGWGSGGQHWRRRAAVRRRNNVQKQQQTGGAGQDKHDNAGQSDSWQTGQAEVAAGRAGRQNGSGGHGRQTEVCKKKQQRREPASKPARTHARMHTAALDPPSIQPINPLSHSVSQASHSVSQASQVHTQAPGTEQCTCARLPAARLQRPQAGGRVRAYRPDGWPHTALYLELHAIVGGRLFR